jgi:ferredoxin-like protein FixX
MKIEIDGLTKRVGNTGDFIKVDINKCNNCGHCLVICVMNLWKKKDGVVYLAEDNKSKCLECASCYQVCDAGAISFQYPAGGTGIVIEQG